MDAPFCEVTGCAARAQWRLILPGADAREDYLCDAHLRFVCSRSTEIGVRYAPTEQPMERQEARSGEAPTGEALAA